MNLPSVAVKNINITKCDYTNKGKPTNYEGILTLNAKYGDVAVEYEYKFSEVISLDLAIDNAAKAMLGSLEELVAAVKKFRGST